MNLNHRIHHSLLPSIYYLLKNCIFIEGGCLNMCWCQSHFKYRPPFYFNIWGILSKCYSIKGHLLAKRSNAPYSNKRRMVLGASAAAFTEFIVLLITSAILRTLSTVVVIPSIRLSICTLSDANVNIITMS